jgi:hypothetical protein
MMKSRFYFYVLKLGKVQSRQGDGIWGKLSRQLTAHGFNATGVLLFWDLHYKVHDACRTKKHL